MPLTQTQIDREILGIDAEIEEFCRSREITRHVVAELAEQARHEAERTARAKKALNSAAWMWLTIVLGAVAVLCIGTVVLEAM